MNMTVLEWKRGKRVEREATSLEYLDVLAGRIGSELFGLLISRSRGPKQLNRKVADAVPARLRYLADLIEAENA
jgi:hypothetical protein